MTQRFENLQELIDLLGDAPDVAELTFCRPSGPQITLKRPSPSQASTAPAAAPQLSIEGEPFVLAAPSAGASPEQAQAGSPAASSAAAAPAPPQETEVLANRVGIYHPAKPPLDAGDPVASGQIVGYIEAIKLMNEVRAESPGVIVEQFVEDGLPVEYGQPLFRIRAE